MKTCQYVVSLHNIAEWCSVVQLIFEDMKTKENLFTIVPPKEQTMSKNSTDQQFSKKNLISNWDIAANHYI